MPEAIPVRPSDLQLDEQNPRLAQPNAGQRESHIAMVQTEDLQRKLLSLAKSVVAYGMNPTELPIVMPRSDDPTRYIIPVGNRRRFLADQQFTGSFTASSSITVVI
jgi:hypothetical protein